MSGLDVNAQDDNGETLLHKAVTLAYPNRALIARLISRYCNDLNRAD